MQNIQKNTLKKLEKEVIGCCILGGTTTFSKIVGLLEKEHLTEKVCIQMFEIMKRLYDVGMSWDLITLVREYHRVHSFDNSYEIAKLTKECITDTYIINHCLYLRELYMERLRESLSHEMMNGNAFDAFVDIEEKIKKAMSVKNTDDWLDMSQVIISVTNHMDKVRGKDFLGVPTGFDAIDTRTAGLQKGQLITIAARPSVGKSAFIGAIAINAATKGYKVGLISLEMPEEQMGARMLAIYSDEEFWRIYRNNFNEKAQEERLFEKMNEAINLPIYMSSKTNVNATDIRAKTDKLIRRIGGLDLLIIDYLQLIEAEGKSTDTREREVSRLCRSLKLMAMDMQIPIVILAQLNRESEKNKSEKPKMSQLRESGSIEQDSDVVMILHRDWKCGIYEDEYGNSTEFEADIIIEKCRNGETGSNKIGFNPSKMAFFNKVENPQLSNQPNNFFEVDRGDGFKPF